MDEQYLHFRKTAIETYKEVAERFAGKTKIEVVTDIDDRIIVDDVLIVTDLELWSIFKHCMLIGGWQFNDTSSVFGISGEFVKVQVCLECKKHTTSYVKYADGYFCMSCEDENNRWLEALAPKEPYTPRYECPWPDCN
jgi:hypothetical protein